MNYNNLFFKSENDCEDLKKVYPESEEDEIEEDEDEDISKEELDELFDKDTYEDKIDDEDLIDE
jgi:hypothetical protein